MSKHKKRKKKRHRPYEPVKMKFVKVENPLRDAPADVRRKAVLEVAAKARVAFEAEYPKIVHWFDTYDPIYILAFCVFYFLTSERGVDKQPRHRDSLVGQPGGVLGWVVALYPNRVHQIRAR